jgi:hypothetical protein
MWPLHKERVGLPRIRQTTAEMVHQARETPAKALALTDHQRVDDDYKAETRPRHISRLA